MVRPVLANPKDSELPPARPPLPLKPGPSADNVADEPVLSVSGQAASEPSCENGREISEPSPLTSAHPVSQADLNRSAERPSSWFLSRYDQTTLAGLLVVSAVAMIGWSAWQAATLRTRMIDIDQTKRTELRFEVDLNTAPVAELANLPGVGPKLATAIVSYRQEHGDFSAVEQLLNVSGIGEAKLKGMLPFLRPLNWTNPELPRK